MPIMTSAGAGTVVVFGGGGGCGAAKTHTFVNWISLLHSSAPDDNDFTCLLPICMDD